MNQISAVFALLLVGGFALPCLSESGESQASSKSVDARGITAVHTATFPNMKYPKFYDKGRKILFTECVSSTYCSIWSMNLDGSGKRELLSNGMNGEWAPGGDKIAYCIPISGPGSEDELTVSDLKTGRKVKIGDIPNCRNLDLNWSARTEEILLGRDYVLSLDTLKRRGLDGAEARQWLEENYSVTRWQGVKPENYRLSLWLTNEDEGFSKLISHRVYSWIKFSPDSAHILAWELGIPTSLIYIKFDANARDRYFQIPFGKNALIEKLGEAYPPEQLDLVLGTGFLEGVVSDAKINPLNDKTIGPGREFKAIARIVKLEADFALLKVTQEAKPVKSGDVFDRLELLWGLRRHKYDGQFDMWHVVEPTSPVPSPGALDAANLSGRWRGAWLNGGTPASFFSVNLRQSGEDITGDGKGSVRISGLTNRGFEAQDIPAKMQFQGKFHDGEFHLIVTYPDKQDGCRNCDDIKLRGSVHEGATSIEGEQDNASGGFIMRKFLNGADYRTPMNSGQLPAHPREDAIRKVDGLDHGDDSLDKTPAPNRFSGRMTYVEKGFKFPKLRMVLEPDGTFNWFLHDEKQWRVDGKYEINGQELQVTYPNGSKDTCSTIDAPTISCTDGMVWKKTE